MCLTLFIELTSDEAVREWLPKFAGIEKSVQIRLCDGMIIRGKLDAQHEAGLTRPDITAAVHYLTFDLDPVQVGVFARGDVAIEIALSKYLEATHLSPDVVAELLLDLR